VLVVRSNFTVGQLVTVLHAWTADGQRSHGEGDCGGCATGEVNKWVRVRVLTDRDNKLGEYQHQSAIEHWKCAYDVLFPCCDVVLQLTDVRSDARASTRRRGMGGVLISRDCLSTMFIPCTPLFSIRHLYESLRPLTQDEQVHTLQHNRIKATSG